MSMFTLSQKVFAVRSYYKTGESVLKVLDCLTRQYGIRSSDDNLATISRIIRTFENTGSVLNRFYYNNGSAQKARPIPKPPVTVFKQEMPPPPPLATHHLEVMTTDMVEIPDDDLIVEVLSEFDPEDNDMDNSDSHKYNNNDEDDDDDDEDDKDEAGLAAQTIVVKAEPPSSSSSSSTSAGIVPGAVVAVDKKPERESLCPQCGESVPVRRFHLHMKAHELGPQLPQKWKCDVCDKEFSSRSNLSTHKYKHIPSAHFVCEICAKVSTNRAIHKNHMLVSFEDFLVFNSSLKVKRLLD